MLSDQLLLKVLIYNIGRSATRINNSSLWIGRVTSSLEAKALAEEFGQAAGSQRSFLEMLKRSTDPDFSSLYIVFGLRIRRQDISMDKGIQTFLPFCIKK